MRLSLIASVLVLFTVQVGVSAFAFAQSNSDRALEVPSRLPPPAPPPAPVEPSDAAPADAAPATVDARPYLGIAVQYIATEDLLGRAARGLEIMSVDPNSPAEDAGLRGQGAPTKLGASGATAGALMPPLDLIVMPLLRRAGDLGDTGDLIVAIDDNRVGGADDLKNALAPLHAGDTLYLTVVRLQRDGSHQTLKIPVKLGAPRDGSGNLVSVARGAK